MEQCTKLGQRFSVLNGTKTSGSKNAIPCRILGTQIDEKTCKSVENCDIPVVLRRRHLAAPKRRRRNTTGISQFSTLLHVFSSILVPRILHGIVFLLPDSPALTTPAKRSIPTTSLREERHNFQMALKCTSSRHQPSFSPLPSQHFTPAPPAPPTMLKKMSRRGAGSSV